MGGRCDWGSDWDKAPGNGRASRNGPLHESHCQYRRHAPITAIADSVYQHPATPLPLPVRCFALFYDTCNGDRTFMPVVTTSSCPSILTHSACLYSQLKVLSSATIATVVRSLPGTDSLLNTLTPNDHYSGRTAPLTSKRCVLYIYSSNIGIEYFKHGIYSLFFSLQNAICFIILTYLVPVLFTFYLQGVLKLKK